MPITINIRITANTLLFTIPNKIKPSKISKTGQTIQKTARLYDIILVPPRCFPIYIVFHKNYQ